MKKQVTKLDFENAFKLLSEINTPEVQATKQPLVESVKPADKTSMLIEDYFNVSDMDDLEEAKDERESEIAKAKLARIEKIVDLDADSEDDLLGSYVGKMIIQCPQCMTVFYKDKEDLVADEADPSTVNVGEVCQHCGNDTGYMLLGKVAEVSEEELADYEAETGEEASEENMELDFTDNEEESEETEKSDEDKEAEEAEEEDIDLDIPDLEEIPTEESEEEEKKEESLETTSTETTPLNENIEADNISSCDESLNNSEALKDAEKHSELKTENESENLTLNESSDSEQIDENLEEGILDTLKAKYAEKKAAKEKEKAGRYVVAYTKYGDDKFVSEEGNVGSFARAKHFDNLEDAEKFASEDGKFTNWKDYFEIKDLGEPEVVEAEETVDVQEACKEDLQEEVLTEAGEISDAAIEDLFNSKEFKTPVSETEIKAIIADESLEKPVFAEAFDSIEDIDEESISEVLSEALTGLTGTTQKVTVESCELAEDKLCIAGQVVTEAITRPINIIFTEAVKDETCMSLRGNIADVDNISILAESIVDNANKVCFESARCKGTVNGKLCESFAKRK